MQSESICSDEFTSNPDESWRINRKISEWGIQIVLCALNMVMGKFNLQNSENFTICNNRAFFSWYLCCVDIFQLIVPCISGKETPMCHVVTLKSSFWNLLELQHIPKTFWRWLPCCGGVNRIIYPFGMLFLACLCLGTTISVYVEMLIYPLSFLKYRFHKLIKAFLVLHDRYKSIKVVL